jgi:hypothetical protein
LFFRIVKEANRRASGDRHKLTTKDTKDAMKASALFSPYLAA